VAKLPRKVDARPELYSGGIAAMPVTLARLMRLLRQ
jgi:hypothetical protein